MTDAAKETMFSLLEKYGFATLVAIACLWVLRQDILLPMVKAHTAFLDKVSETQTEIAEAVHEQTRLLYALRPQVAGTSSGDDAPQN